MKVAIYTEYYKFIDWSHLPGCDGTEKNYISILRF